MSLVRLFVFLGVSFLASCGGGSEDDEDSRDIVGGAIGDIGTVDGAMEDDDVGGDFEGGEGSVGDEDSSVSVFSLGGTVRGLTGTLVITNSLETLIVSGDVFTFKNKLEKGQAYSVQVVIQPEGQICIVGNGEGVIPGDNVSDVHLVCAVEQSYSISGEVSATAFTVIDSDTNEPATTQGISNDGFITAQQIPNYSIVHGFSSAVGSNSPQDVFEVSGDVYDVYKIQLQKDQMVALQVVDFDAGETYQGDLDLFLFDADFNVVAQSVTVSEFEAVQVPDDGEYYIAIYAYSGISKYLLILEHVGAIYPEFRSTSVDFAPTQGIVKFKLDAPVSSLSGASDGLIFRRSNTSAVRSTLVGFDTQNIYISLSSNRVSEKESNFLRQLAENNADSYQKLKTLQAIKKLSQRHDVEYAEPNYIVRGMRVPDDTYYATQWHYQNIHLEQAWDITTGTPLQGEDVIVAVIDTGVFLEHEDLQGQLIAGYDFIEDITRANDKDGLDDNPDDPGDSIELGRSSWHGTHVSGTIAARTNNRMGLAGVSWGAKIMPLRALGVGGGTAYDILQSVLYAAGLANDSGTLPARKADIINLSLGSPGFLQSAQDVFAAVRKEGIIVIAAAGNANSSQLSYPASYEGVVSVSATDYNNDRATYSNFGSTIDVAAPGGDVMVDLNQDRYVDGVFSCLVDDSSGQLESQYVAMAGTSMAAPHVAGVVALMKAVYPDLTPNEFDTLLSGGLITVDLGPEGRDDDYGHGFIDAFMAVREARRLAGGGQLPSVLSVSPPSVSVGSSGNSQQFTVTNVGARSGMVTMTPPKQGWLSIQAQEIDENNLGAYLVKVDRSSLSEGYYSERIRFTAEAGNSVEILVSMNVGAVSSAGELGKTWVLLLDSDFEFVNQTLTAATSDGVYRYGFDDVPVGTYYLLGGSDVDYDDFICQAGESCGGYPMVDQLSPVELRSGDLTDIDFALGLGFGISNNSTLLMLNNLSGEEVLKTDKKVVGFNGHKVQKKTYKLLPN
ncbi:MAG: S8 family peptidase [Pseudomonadales bacterium]|nr:S8 family peptidase [Pseudomonadales bacterium]